MKIFRILLLLPAFLLISGSGYSQAWLKDIAGTKKANGQELNFYDIQNAFNTYWDGKTVEKGKGFKQFRRWEYFMEPRVYPSGNLNLPGLWKAYDEIQSAQKTEVNNSAWTSLGPFLIPEKASGKNKAGMGRINCIAFHPSNANIFYVGSPSGGIWKTTNGGQTWSTSSDNLLSIGVSDIAINPSDPNIVYIATGDGDAGDTYGIGVLKSTNGGTSWNATALSLEQSQSTSFRRILINPVNPNILLACSTTGIYRSDDGFATFKIVQYGNFKDMEFKPDDPNVVYAASYASDGSAKVYVSSDGGNTFAQSKTGLLIDGKVNRVELAVTPASPGYVFALCSDSNNDGFYALYRSTDAAGKWTKIYPNTKKNLLGWTASGTDTGGQGWYDLAMCVSPVASSDVYVGGVNIYKSVNTGSEFNITAHWVGTDNAAYVHADQHMLAFNPLNNYLYSCNDGGVYVSKDGGVTWDDLSDGLSILQIYKISASDQTPDLFLSGNQDNGSYKRLNGVWKELAGADGMECWIDPTNDDNIYVSTYYGSFYRSMDGGDTLKYISPADGGQGYWVTPFVINESQPSHIYAAYSDIFKSVDRGDTWTKISDKLIGTNVFRSMAVFAGDDNFIYAASATKLFRTTDGGQNWTDITNGLSTAQITSVTISPYDPMKVWVTHTAYLPGEKVYYSDNGGDSWTNYSDG
ncbi:MAG: hypothetical protein H6538_08025, partial [Bacteroidales bacterium]|nr:hypothetical protein [Bacteroidales bacterium]